MPERKLFLLLVALAFACAVAPLVAEVPYDSYLYNRWMEPIAVPHSYVPDSIYTGKVFGEKGLNSPQGMFVERKNAELFIADSGNNRVVRLSGKWDLLSVYEGFNDPSDVYVSEEGIMYVADTGNSRIVVMDLMGNIKNIFGKPETDLISGDFIYSPLKVVADRAGRIYVVAQGVNEGLIELNKDGVFKGYFGASKVSVNIIDYFWKLFSTNEQRRQMERFVPTVYNNITLDAEGFLMVTTSALTINQIFDAIYGNADTAAATPVRRLNPKGDDILKRDDWYPPVGDLRFMSADSGITGASAFGDIVVDDFGIYHVLDMKRGRVFTYDPDGTMLSIFGGLGHRKGLLQNPKAIELLEDKILVLDSKNNSVTAYRLTAYGSEVQNAIRNYYSGHYTVSLTEWLSVLLANVNFEWAYYGIGKSYYRNDQYADAMRYFKIIRYPGPYSRAFKYYRKELVEKYFGFIVFGIAAVSIGISLLVKRYRKNNRGRRV